MQGLRALASRHNLQLRLAAASVAVGLIWGCGGTTVDSTGVEPSAPAGTSVVVTGVAQKGPFTELQVQARNLDSPNQPPVEAQILDGGEFRVELRSGAPWLLEASGEFVDELTGEPVALNTPMTALLVPRGDARQNINVLTHGIAQAARAQGALSGAALQQVTLSVLGALGFGADTQAGLLDINQISAGAGLDDPNLQLLLIAAAVMDLPRDDGAMPQAWGGFGLGGTPDAPSLPYELFAGLDALELLERVRAADVIRLPELQLADNTSWACNAVACGFAEVDFPGYRIAGEGTYEGAGFATVRVRRSGDKSQAQTVRVVLEADTATAGADFDATAFDLRFVPGQTQREFRVPLYLDGLSEPDERFAARIESVTPASPVNTTRADVVITDGVPPGLDAAHTSALTVSEFCVVDAAETGALTGDACDTRTGADTRVPLLGDALGGLRAVATLATSCSQAVCPDALRAYQVDFSLLARDANGLEQQRVPAGSYWYRGFDLARSGGNATPGTPLIDFALSAPGSRELLSRAALNNWQTELQLDLRGSQPATQTAQTPGVLPLDGTVAFGDRQTRIASGQAVSLAPSVSCPADSLSLTATFIPADPGLDAAGQPGADGTSCVALADAGNGLLAATTLRADINAAGTAWPLPVDHGGGALVQGFVLPFALPAISIPGAQAGTNLLIAGDLPFALRLTGGRLTENGLVLTHDGTAYLRGLGLSASDPRSSAGLRSNDVLYSAGAEAGELRLSQTGLNGELRFAAGAGGLAYPDMAVDWSAFRVSLADSAIADSFAVNLDLALAQSTTCTAGTCAPGPDRAYSAGGLVRIDPNGHAVGTVSMRAAAEPAFGARDGAQMAFSRADDLAPNTQATAAWVGYRLDAGAPAVGQLPGHVQRGTSGPHTVHMAGSAAYTRGNHAPAGLSVGPELYADASGQPVVGTGRSLAGTSQTLFNGMETASLRSALGTKYVLRRSGFTGVFNADPAALADPVRYNGYALDMSRFAWRAVDNTLDEFNWIDGQLALAGDAGLGDILFENLVLDCAGQFGDGRLVFESCDGGDGNANGVIDENCPVPMGAWQMETRLNSLRFGGADGAAVAACDTGQQTLALGQDVQAAALTRPVAMELGWAPDGSLRHQQARGLGQAALEQGADPDSSPGFAVALSDAALAVDTVSDADRSRYGWLAGTTRVALPFWSAVEADFRVANRSVDDDGYLPDPSLLVPAGKLTKFTAARANETIAGEFEDSGDAEFQVRYDWGNTGLGFQLPAYFTPRAFNADSALPTFIGKGLNIPDLIVLDVDAGIDFIEPVRTKFSFGASADIQAIREFEFQVDLTAADSLDKVDGLLIQAGVIQGPILAPTLSRVQDSLVGFNRFADRGLDELTERALLLAVTRLGAELAPASPFNEDPIVTLSSGLSTLHSLPDQVVKYLDTAVREPLDAQLLRVQQQIRQPLLEVKQDLRTLDPGDGTVGQLRSRIDEIRTANTLSRDTLNTQIDRLQQPFDHAQGLVDKANQIAARVDAVRSQVRNALRFAADVESATCETTGPKPETAGHLDALFEQIDLARTLLTIAQGTELLVPLIELAADDPTVAQAMRDTQATIQMRAEELDARLTQADMRIRGIVCGVQVDEVLEEVDAFFTAFDTQFNAAKANIALVQQAIDTVKALIEQIQAPAQKVFTLVEVNLDDIDGRLARLEAGTTGQQIEDAVEAVYADLYQQAFENTPFDSALVNAYVKIDADEVDAFDIVLDRIDASLDTAFGKLEEQLRNDFAKLLPGQAYTPDELRLVLVGLMMESKPVQDLRDVANTQIDALQEKVNELVLDLTDQVNMAVKGALAKVEGRVNAVLETATAPLNKVPLNSARIDGFAVIAGNELERAHVGAEFDIPSSTEGEPSKRFGAAIDAVSWSANNKTAGCSIEEGESRLDITISATNIPANFGTSQIIMKKVYLGFTLGEDAGGVSPKGVFGGLQTQGDIGFTEFVIYDPGFAAGFGDKEIYIGARAGAVFSTIAAELAFFAGKTCNQEILLELDPTVAQFIPLPDNGFIGVYARAAASIPVYSNGCPLTLGVAADVGAWVLAGPPVTVGGLVGGGAFGKVGCVGALRGQLRAIGSLSTEGDMVFVGEGFGAAGVGLCEPASWTSIDRARADGLCATADARIQAGYINGWSLIDLDVSAVH